MTPLIALVAGFTLCDGGACDAPYIDNPDAGYLAPAAVAKVCALDLPDGGTELVTGWTAMSPGRALAVEQVVDGASKSPAGWLPYVAVGVSTAVTLGAACAAAPKECGAFAKAVVRGR